MSNIQEFDYSVNLLQSILWQYDNSTNLIALINSKQAWYTENQSTFWDDWFTDVFDLTTANEFGLAVWSIILGLPFFVYGQVDPEDKPIFGFNEFNPSPPPDLLSSFLNFENSNFSVMGSPLALTVEEQRWLLRIRYFQLASCGAIDDYAVVTSPFVGVLPEGMGINNFLRWLSLNSSTPMDFDVYVLDGLNMTIRYIFSEFPTPAVQEILNAYDILPRPAGVGITRAVTSGEIFGFGLYYQNFNNGNFFNPFF